MAQCLALLVGTEELLNSRAPYGRGDATAFDALFLREVLLGAVLVQQQLLARFGVCCIDQATSLMGSGHLISCQMARDCCTIR